MIAFDSRNLRAPLLLACRWLIDVALVREARPQDIDLRGILSGWKTGGGDDREPVMNYPDWRGAIRGEYRVATKAWEFYCPAWHTGQAVKALALAARALNPSDPAAAAEFLDAARYAAEFLERIRIGSEADPNFGMILAHEDMPGGVVNISAILESVDGLLALAELTGEQRWSKTAIEALDWVARKTYCRGEGVFEDAYNPQHDRFVAPRPDWAGRDNRRPLLDGAVFLRAARVAQRPGFRTLFFEVAERLLAEEDPPGNWIGFHPCSKKSGSLHPRMAFWWGLPMLDAWQESGDRRYLDCAVRAGNWYVRAMRKDGGIFRDTDPEFQTPSFGHCTSASACAAIFFVRLVREAGRNEFEQPLQRALAFCRGMQLIEPGDPNLRGVLIEQLLAPGGTDASPYHIRDLATIFYIQAAALALQ